MREGEGVREETVDDKMRKEEATSAGLPLMAVYILVFTKASLDLPATSRPRRL